ncbi:hypothetical protein ACHHYP_06778, partial [Achlya hypogyna]
MPVETKIVSRALAKRLGPVLPQLVHPDQKGFISGRKIHDHIMHLQELQHYATTNDTPAYATFLDFEKAYDRVDWTYLEAALRRFNVGPGFIKWFKLLYHKPIVNLLLNGEPTSAIYPNRGVKQGDPLSSLLFVLAVEPLAEHLRRAPDLGLSLPGHTPLTNMLFADDCTLLSPSLTSLRQQLQIVDKYCSVSGAKLNLNKCKTLTLNAQEPPPAWPGLQVLPTGMHVKYLGVWFGHNIPQSRQVEFLLQQFYTSFLQWGSRARTVQGRILLVQTKFLARLWHYSAVLVIPDTVINKMQSMVNKYVVGNKIHKAARYLAVARRGLMFDHELGLRIPHVRSIINMQRLRLLQRWISSPVTADSSWSTQASHRLAEAMGPFGQRDRLDFL